MAKMRHT